MDHSDFNTRLNEARRDIEIDPTDIRAWFLQGWAHLMMGSIHDAISSFDRTIALRSKLRPTVWWWTDACPYAFRAEAYCELGDLDRALADCIQAIKHAPSDHWARHVLGRVYLIKREYESAIETFSEAIALHPDSPPTYLLRADAHCQIGQLDSAICDANEAIKLVRNDPYPWFVRGRLFLMKQSYAAAISDFDKAIAANTTVITERHLNDLQVPNSNGNVTTHRLYALYLCGFLRCYYLQDFVGSETDCSHAIREDPNHGRSYIVRAHARRHLGRYSEAIEDHTTAIRLVPNDPYAYLSRGQALQHCDRTEEAIADYSEAIRLAPKWSAAFCCRGRAMVMNGDYDGAMLDFDEAIRLDPKNESAIEQRTDLRRVTSESQAYAARRGAERDIVHFH